MIKMATALLAAVALTSCGGGSGSSATPPAAPTPPTPAAPVSISVTPTSASVLAGVQQQFVATVSNSTNTAVTWQVNGTAGGNPTVGAISSSGEYTAPLTVPSPAQVTVTAVAQADTSKSANSPVTIQGHFSTQSLNGAYVFRMVGNVPGGNFRAIGRFTADGQGNLSGTCDETIASGVFTTSDITGSYSVDPNGIGTLSLQQQKFSQTLAFNLSEVGPETELMEYDDTGFVSGAFMKQDPTVLQTSSLNGTYVFTWEGLDSTGPNSTTLGRFAADGKGSISGGSEELSQAGVFTSNVPISGTYSVSSDGSGTATISSASSSNSFVLFVGDADHIYLRSTTGAKDYIGFARRQSGNFSVASLNGAYIWSFAGQHVSNFDDIFVSLGRVTADGTGQISSGTVDAVDALTGPSTTAITGNYAVDSNGRGVAQFVSSTGTSNLVFYMLDPTELLALRTDPDIAEVGTARLQQAVTFSTATLSGPYSGVGAGSLPISGLGVPVVSIAVRGVADGSGTLNGNMRVKSNIASPQTSQSALDGTYSIGADGRGSASIAGLSTKLVIYAISDQEIWMQAQDSTAARVLWKKQF